MFLNLPNRASTVSLSTLIFYSKNLLSFQINQHILDPILSSYEIFYYFVKKIIF